MKPEDIVLLRRDLAAVRTWIEKLCNAIKKHSEAIYSAQEAQRKHDAVQKPIPVVVSYDQQTIEDQKGQYGTQDAIRKWTKRAVIAASVYAAIAAYQGIQMKKATKATEKAAAAAQSAATTANNTFRLTYRPRLSIPIITPNLETSAGVLNTNLDKGRMTVRIDVPNTGPFPARNVKFFRYDNVSRLDQVAQRPYGEALLGEPDFIPPKAEGGATGMIITGQKVLSSSDLAGLINGTLYATFSIMVVYDDDLGETHHAEYCHLFTFRGYSEFCPWPVRND